MFPTIKCSHPHRRRGFSLAETAIALGVVAVILAGVFTIVPGINDNAHSKQALEDVGLVVNGMRAISGGTAGVPDTASGYQDTTANLIKAKAIPSYMVRPAALCGTAFACADHPLYLNVIAPPVGGSFRVCNWHLGVSAVCTAAPVFAAGNTSNPYFAVEFLKLTLPACILLLQNVTNATGTITGLMDVVINGTSMLNATVNFAPLSPANQALYCKVGGNASSVEFVYRVTAPNN